MLGFEFMNIGFTFNVKKNLPSADSVSQIDAEFDSLETISAIKKALESGGNKVIEIEANSQAYIRLYQLKETMEKAQEEVLHELKQGKK